MRVLAAFSLNMLFNFAVGLLVAKFLGPAEYGRFALAFATAIVVQTAFLDWLRLGATRFYSERSRGEDPALRATLDLAFASVAVGLALGSGLLFLTGVRFPLSNGLIALALGAAVANGLFDFSMALVRARFRDGLYVKLVVIKNLFALVLTGGGAFWFGSAHMALVGGIVSLAGSVVCARAALADPAARPRLACRDVAASLVRYAVPIVAANVLYLSLPLANRALVTVFYGFGETGQFSLAWDIGSKGVQAIGSMLDVVLFQIAVRVLDHEGAGGARQRLAANMAIVVAILLPACAGIWAVLPSVQQIIVPEPYRGPFARLLTLMLPGLFCYAMIQYAINPIFQIAKQTVPLITAAAIACLADPLILLAMPHGGGAARLALAQSGAFAAALAALVTLARRSSPAWPRLRDMAGATLGTAAMVAVLLPLRARPPGLLLLATQIAVGLAVYGGLVALFDIAAIRSTLVVRLRPLIARWRAGADIPLGEEPRPGVPNRAE